MISFKITGIVKDEGSGRPLPGFFVKAYDKDLLFDDLLGSALTDPSGKFEIVSGPGDFRDFFESRPDIYFKVYQSAGGELIHDTSDALHWNIRRNTAFEILVPAYALNTQARFSSPTITLLSEEGVPVESPGIGDSLIVQVEGLDRMTPYTITVSEEEGPLFTSTLITSIRGEIEPTVLWPQMGFDDPAREGSFTIREALERWQGRRLSVSIARDREVLATRDFRIEGLVQRPLVLSTDAEGRILNGFEAGREDLRLTVHNLSEEGRARVYMVRSQQNWSLDDPFQPALLSNGELAIMDVELAEVRDRGIIDFARADTLLPGAYDFFVRPLRYGYEEDERLTILRTDIIGSRRVTGLVIRENFWLAKPVLGGCVNKLPMSGRIVSGAPYFQYADSFEIGEAVYAALDPGILDPGNVSKMCALYVIPSKNNLQWNIDNSLNHLPVLGGNSSVLIRKVQTGCINMNTWLVWPSAQQPGEYDIIADFGNNTTNASNFVPDNAYNTPLDIIDGYFVAGFRVVEDPGTLTNFANTGNWNYDENVVTSMGLTGTVSVADEAGAYHNPGGFSTVNVNVPLKAHVYFPADVAGVTDPAQISAAAANYPLIVIIHGNGHSYTSYDFLLQHFAANGFIAASIHLNSNMSGLGRANVFFKHMTVLQTKFGVKLQNNIGIMGHSRGGEAVLKAARINQQNGLGHNINAVISLAPTDQYGSEVLGGAWAKPYFVLYGSRDGDTSGGTPYAGYDVPNIGFALYDRASGANKSMCFLYGATHNGFITSNDSGITGAIPEATQKKVVKAYMNAFFRQYLKNESKWAGVFTGEWKPASVAQTGAKLFMQYRDTVLRKVDEFEGAVSNWQASTIGGTVSQSGLPASPQEGKLCDFPPTSPGLDPRSPHDTKGMRLRWDSSGDRLEFSIPAAQKDVSGYGVLSFRITQVVNGTGNTANQSQNLRVALKDSANNERAIRVSPFGDIPFPDPHPFGYTKSAMNTIRIPLTSYSIVCAGQVQVNLQDVTTLSFVFLENTTGDISIDDIEFSN